MIEMIYPNWPAPKRVKSFTTTRLGGISKSPFDSLNMGSRTGDQLEKVSQNRLRVIESQNIPSEPHWLHQTHSTIALNISEIESQAASGLIDPNNRVDADASYTCKARQVSVVLTADCMPVLFCSSKGDQVAAAHAGWRGLCHGILEETVKYFTCPKSEIIAWMGPAIGATKFEVGHEVKNEFEKVDPNASQAFTLIKVANQKYLADLYFIARLRLNTLGITQVYGGEHCTYTEQHQFYSYRREKVTGRMASMIWFE